MLSITDASGRTTSYEYDQLDRVKKITDPLNNITQFEYDQWGNLTSKINPNNQTITYDYDWLNRMTKKKYVGTGEEFSYTYKEDTPLLLSASAPSGTINYDYDELYRLTQVVDQYFNTTGYEYDEGSRRKKMTVSATGDTCNYGYDNSNQLLSITDNYGGYDFQYDAFGRMSRKAMSNGTYTEYISDHLGRLKSLMNYKGSGAVTAPGSVISQYLSEAEEDFDLLGNRKKVNTLDGNYEYKYDSIYQLTESKVNSLMSESYQYDSVGNRLKGQGPGVLGQGDYLYDNGNRLETLTHETMTLSYTYDNNGNRITKTDTTGVINYTYDYDNRLKRIDFTDSTYAEYTYDALGRRIEKRVKGQESSSEVVTRYCYDGEDIVAVLDSTNTAVASITHGTGIDHPLSYKNIATGQVYYYNQDYLGSITSITDSAQTVVISYKYDSYGNLLTPLDPGPMTLIYSYTGREYDQESGLYFYRARYYDSKVGRFLQTDPIGFLGGMNFYAYVGNNPVNFVDPWGWCKKKKSLLLLVGGATIVNPLPGDELLVWGGAGLVALGWGIINWAKEATREGGTIREGRDLNEDEAAERLRNGGDVAADSQSEAERIARKAGNGKNPVHDIPHDRGGTRKGDYRPHYHPYGRPGGHVWYPR